MKSQSLIATIMALSLALLGCGHPKIPNYEYCREINADSDLYRLKTGVQMDGAHAYSLQELVDIGLQNNLDIRLQCLETKIQKEKISAEVLKMLPGLEGNGEYSYRNKNTAYTSDVVGGSNANPSVARSNAPTISSEQNVKRFDLAAVFNVLDFGLSYLKSRQEVNKALMLKQRHLRAQQNLVFDIHKAYYRAIVAKNALLKSNELIALLEKRDQLLKMRALQQVISEVESLINRDRLVEMKIKLQGFNNEYQSAMTELLGLIGAVPAGHFEIQSFELQTFEPAEFNIAELEKEALRYRPELMSQDIQVSVDADEVRSSMLRLFPQLSPFYGYYTDGNKYLVFNNWLTVGLRTTFDLLSMPSTWKEMNKNQYQKLLARKTRLSMSMGILTQVHLSFINVKEALVQHALAQELFDVKRSLWDFTRKNQAAGRVSQAEVNDRQIEAFFSEVNLYKAYANVQVALEQLANAVGRPEQFVLKPLKEDAAKAFSIEETNDPESPAPPTDEEEMEEATGMELVPIAEVAPANRSFPTQLIPQKLFAWNRQFRQRGMQFFPSGRYDKEARGNDVEALIAEGDSFKRRLPLAARKDIRMTTDAGFKLEQSAPQIVKKWFLPQTILQKLFACNRKFEGGGEHPLRLPKQASIQAAAHSAAHCPKVFFPSQLFAWNREFRRRGELLIRLPKAFSIQAASCVHQLLIRDKLFILNRENHDQSGNLF